jgi:ATP-binding cassette subfamily B multidrug efflux pump
MKNLTKKILFKNIWLNFFILFVAFISTILSLLSPFFQKEFIDSLLQTNVSTFKYRHEIIFISMAVLFSFTSQLLLFFNKYVCYIEASKIQKWLSELIYQKTLNLKRSSKLNFSSGKIISIFSSDCLASSNIIDDVLPNSISYVIPIILAPIAVTFFSKINPLPIFIIIFLILFLNFLLAFKQGKLFSIYKNLSALRVAVVTEWLNNIRSIKILDWTNHFEMKIKNTREQETQNRLTMVTNGSTLNSISYSSPYFINLISVFILVKFNKGHISPGEIFSLLWIFGVILTRPMRMLPMLLVTIIDCYSSIKRVEDFLGLESENEKKYIENKTKINNIINDNVLEIKNLKIVENKKVLLDNISLTIKSGEFVGIIGEVGSGKSLLIKSILGFIECEYEKFLINNQSVLELSLQERRNNFSYVAQELFIMNSTLRDNIALSYKTLTNNDEYIKNSLRLSEFSLFSENFNYELDSEIGEKGVNLSGGQKQRISIARAHYFNRKFILLDDSFSALDINTEEKIINNLFKTEWKDKTKIIVTHRHSILKYCDKVYILKNGKLNEVH